MLICSYAGKLDLGYRTNGQFVGKPVPHAYIEDIPIKGYADFEETV